MKKRSAMLAVTSMLFLMPQVVSVHQAKAATSTTTKTPTQDGTWDNTGNDSTLTEDYVGESDSTNPYGEQKSAIQFDLSTVTGYVTKATLRLYITEYHHETTAGAPLPYVTLVGSTADTWGSSFPMNGSDQILYDKDINLSAGTWKEFDVTNFVTDRFAHGHLVSFAVLGNNTGSFEEFAFASDNYTTDLTLQPQLVVETSPTPPYAQQPTVSTATTSEDHQSTTGLQITPNAADGTNVQFYRISSIVGGRLFKNDGTTEILNADYITAAEGNAGLKFTPDADTNSNGGGSYSFNVQAAFDTTGSTLSIATQAVVNVTEVNDPPTASDDVLAAVNENASQQTIPFATLLANDSPGPSNENGQSLTITSVSNPVGGSVSIQGTDVLFTPDQNYHGTASFQYTVQDNGTTNGAADPKTAQANASFTINQVAHQPSVTTAVTAEDSQSTSGLVITPDALDGTDVTHFKITGITGGTLYKQDGVTAIHNGDFITATEGGDGLKFTPNANANTKAGDTFSFQVQAALDGAGKGLSSTAASATITVNEVNDPPTAVDDALSAMQEDSGDRIIPFADLLGNDSAGPANESGQTLTIASVDNATGGQVRIEGTNVIFTPDPNYNGAASFRYTVQDNGTTNNTPDPKTAQATASFTINSVADTPSVTSAVTAEDTQTTSGLVITRNAADGADVKQFKITGITGGLLFKQDGITPINDGDFITIAEGGAGLKFTPDANANSPASSVFSFKVQAALDNAGTGLSDAAQATVTVSEVNDGPTATDDVLSAIQEDAGDRVIPFADLLGNDSAGPANESGQTLTIASVDNATGGQVRIEGTNVIFTPDPNYNGAASFRYTVQDNGTTNNTPDPKTAQATASFTINSVADTPSVTSAVTAEDTQTTSGLVITRNAADGADVTQFKITGITGGMLFKQDGITPIHDGDFITIAEGGAGLKFTPDADANSPASSVFSFKVQAALDNAGTGLSDAAQATVTVSEVNDGPTATDDVLSAIQEDAGDRVIPFADLLVNDAAGPANENGQTLTIPTVGNATGGQVRIQGTDVIFTPDPNYHGTASFYYFVEDNGTTNGAPDAKMAQAKVSFPITPVADIPGVTNTQTQEDTQSTNGLVITPNAADGAEVTHFKISEITGGTLYKNDGVTPIHNDDFITVAEGGAGLKFTPDANASNASGGTFSFKVQAALDTAGTGISDAVQATINVTEVNDPPLAADDSLSSVPENSGERTIPVADLLANDSTGPANESGQTLKIASVGNAVGGTVRIDGANVYFTPFTNYHGAASFDYTVEDNGTTNGVPDPKTATATVSFTIDARADIPSVTNAVTPEDTQSMNGLVITPTSGSGATATHFRISEITGGTLYLNDGTTQIQNGEYITVADGGAGLKFTPDADANGTTGFGFKVQAAPTTDGTRLSDAVQASITVTEVNDAPVATDDMLPKVTAGTAKVTIPFSSLTANDLPGPSNENTQSLTVVDVSGAEGGTVSLVGDHVEFVPDSGFKGLAKFTYTVRDNGTTNGVPDPKTATAVASFYVVDESQPVITLNGDSTMYLLKGQPYVEPGYTANDDVDKDLTNQVTVTGTVNTDQLGTYQLHYNVADSSGNAAPEAVRTVQVVSDDLATLSVQSGTLKPAFDPATQEYTVTVPFYAMNVTIAASAADPTANLTINGDSVGKDGSKTMKLNFFGKNESSIVVTAQGGATKTYQLVVERQWLPSNGGGSNDNHDSDVRHATVDTGEKGDGHVVQLDITRTQGANGTVTDSVVMNAAQADEVIQQAAADGGKTARIVIDDVPGKPADEVNVNVSGAALAKMKAAHLGLVIEAGGSKITLSSETLSQMGQGGTDLFFRVVPIRKPDARQQVEQRVADSKVINDYAKGEKVKIVGQPMTIETNYASRKTEVMLPLNGISLPSDPKEREAFLRGLAVYVEHSDGEKVVESGNIVYDAAGNPVGLEIEVEKFSTFTIISANVPKSYAHYISGYPDGTFRPLKNITRAELASILARELKLDTGSAAQANQYPDVADSHWASKAILELRAAGVLTGDETGNFRPDQAVTRAEMAVIASKLKKLDAAGAPATFQDAKGHWAAAVIAAVKQAGLMAGYEDGTFRPDQTLTRAEAVTVLNRVFDRPVLKNQQQATWPDVSLTDWYASDIESASNDIRQFSDGRIEKTESKE